MNDSVQAEAWPDRALSEPQKDRRDRAALVPVERTGVAIMNFAQMVEYAQFMSTARGAVGAHLMGNVGACLAVMEIGNQFGLPHYAVARQSYLVNGRVAFMGQFFHTVIENFAPLEKGPNGRKLQFRYEGEGDDLKIIVSGTFKGASEPVIYESPTIKNIAVKNSPLWKTEPRRQLIYFGVRGWQTINWPEGMLHVISDDEAAALPPSEYARDVTPAQTDVNQKSADLRARLAAGREAGQHAEGFKEGFTEAQFTEVAAEPATPAETSPPIKTMSTEADVAAKPAVSDFPGDTPMPGAKPPRKRKAKTDSPPSNVEDWREYALAWIGAESNADALHDRWASEEQMRDDLGVTSEEFAPVFARLNARVDEIAEKGA